MEVNAPLFTRVVLSEEVNAACISYGASAIFFTSFYDMKDYIEKNNCLSCKIDKMLEKGQYDSLLEVMKKCEFNRFNENYRDPMFCISGPVKYMN